MPDSVTNVPNELFQRFSGDDLVLDFENPTPQKKRLAVSLISLVQDFLETARHYGRIIVSEVFIPTKEKVSAKFPLLLTTGRILSQYNVGAQTRRTENNIWHPEDILEIHPHDAEERSIQNNDLVMIKSRKGETSLHARISERMQPGVVYTTFHMPFSGANIVTTEYSDWATECPEYKVTAVQCELTRHISEWQQHFLDYQKQHHKAVKVRTP